MNFWDISILAAVGLMVGLAVFRLRKKKKTGCPGCCACCSAPCQNEKQECIYSAASSVISNEVRNPFPFA